MSDWVPDAELDLSITESPQGRVFAVTALTPAAADRFVEALHRMAAWSGGPMHRDFWSMVLQYREATPNWAED